MDDSLQQYLIKLRIIARIDVNQRLDTTNNAVRIYGNSWLDWGIRKICSDGKKETFRYLQNLYREIDQQADQLINLLVNSKDDIKQKKALRDCVTLAEKIKLSIRGLNNLYNTYKGYQDVQAGIESIREDFALRTYDTLLETIPADKLTEILLEPIPGHYSLKIDEKLDNLKIE